MSKSKTIKLSYKLTQILLTLPETGMGYQIVKVILKNLVNFDYNLCMITNT